MFIIIFLILFLTPRPSLATALPISGTFVVPDLSYKSESEYRQFIQELKDTGINTVIFTLTDYLTKNCQSNTYTENKYLSTTFAGSAVPFFPTMIKLSKELNIKIFFSLGNTDVQGGCFQYHNGTVGNENTDKGKLIAASLRTIDTIKNTIHSMGLSWDDPIFEGFYIFQEESTRMLSITDSLYGVSYPQFRFFKDISRAVKQKEPSKKILISPFQLEDTDYDMSKQAFSNLFSQTDIDIIAPQDSLGSRVTTSLEKSVEHFRALHDAAIGHPTKQGWANIETFAPGPDGDSFVRYVPSEISKIKQQVTAASPYVPKLITWIYQHTMLSNPLSDNIAATNIYAPQYTPSNAALRKKLRNEYLAEYGKTIPTISTTNSCHQLYFFNTTYRTCQLTTDSYNSLQKNCNNSTNTCTQNLKLYLAGKTTGVCYLTQSECQNSNIPTPTKTITYTPSPTKIITQFTTKTPTLKPTSKDVLNGDANRDGIVDIADYSIWYKEFFDQIGLTSDFSGKLGVPDGIVDIYDYSVWYSEFSRYL